MQEIGSSLFCGRLIFRSQVFVMLALSEDEVAESLLVELHSLELEHDRLPNDRLLLRVAHPGEEWVLQALLQRDSIVGVEDQNLLQEVDCLRRRAGVFLEEVRSGIGWELLEILQRFQVGDETLVRFGRGADDGEYDCKLVVR